MTVEAATAKHAGRTGDDQGNRDIHRVPDAAHVKHPETLLSEKCIGA
jgi:hypothetical protein